MKHLFFLFAIVVSVNSFANDGGMAFIDVKGINPKTNAKDGTKIEFYGKDAANFMKLLPEYSSVLHGMVRPDVAEKLQENQRGVAIIRKGWGLEINCAAGDIGNHGSYDIKKEEFIPSTPKCSISLTKKLSKDDLGDSWSMEPKNYRKSMCQ